MSLRGWIVGATAVALLSWLPAPVSAGGGATSSKNSKPPKASSVLIRSLKALQTSRGYRATLEVQGGVTNRKDHRVAAPTVRRSYSAEVYGGLMSLSTPRVYRTRSKGAIRHDGSWKALLAADEGVTLERLFAFPEEILVAAVKNRSTAKWHVRKSRTGSAEKKRAESPKARDSGRSGRTVVVEKDDEIADFPGRIRVEAPPKEALQQVLVVQNSGCFGGG